MTHHTLDADAPPGGSPGAIDKTSCLSAYSLVSVLLMGALSGAPADARILFNEVTGTAGVDDTGETYGTAVGDINGDGCPDVWIDHHQYTPTVILRNRCDGSLSFEQLIEEPNGSDPSDVLGRYFIETDTHGVGFGDFDGDGDRDMIEVSGASYYNLFWVNDGLGNFTESDAALGFIWPIDTNRPPLCTSLRQCRPTGRRSPMWFDYNADGKLDVMITSRGNYRAYQEPTATFVQTQAEDGSPRFVYDGSTGIDYRSLDFCAYATMAEVTGDDVMDVLCADDSRLMKIWDISGGAPFRMVGQDEIGSAIFSSVPYDLAIADFDGDLRNEMFMPTGNSGSLLIDQVDGRTLHYMHRKDVSDHAGFSFTAEGDVTFEFDWWTKPENIRLGSGAGAPPPGSNLRIHDKTGNRVRFTLSPTNPAHVGAPTYTPGVSQGVYIWFDGARWQVRTSNIRFSFDFVGMVVQAGQALTDLRIEAGLARIGQTANRVPSLFAPDEDGRYVDASARIEGETPSSCVSAAAGDFNNDGHLDVIEICGGMLKNLPNRVYENDGQGNLVAVPGAGSDAALGYSGAEGQMPFGRGHSVLTADFDRDGRLDVFLTNGHPFRPFSTAGRQQVIRNVSDSGNNWVQIDLEGVLANRDAIGARVFITTPDGRKQLREQSNGMHKYAQNFNRLHVGLGSHTSFDIEVQWPLGEAETYPGLSANKIYRCVQSGGCDVVYEPEPIAGPACGAPTYNSATENAVFLWRDCGDQQRWSALFTAGGISTSFRGTISSDGLFQGLAGVSQEGSDVLTPAPFDVPTGGPINYVQNVGATGFDGFDFRVAPDSEVCFAPTVPADRPVYIGADREPVTTPINLRTFTPCTP